jgi:hypothetical protein
MDTRLHTLLVAEEKKKKKSLQHVIGVDVAAPKVVVNTRWDLCASNLIVFSGPPGGQLTPSLRNITYSWHLHSFETLGEIYGCKTNMVIHDFIVSSATMLLDWGLP